MGASRSQISRPKRANEISVAMDGVLGRVKVAVAKGGAFETVRKEISAQIDRLDTSYQGDTRVAERLRKAITLGSRSTDVGMAGRLLREFVLTQILAPADIKKMTPFATMQELRRQLISEWIICYLQLLHAFGNEVAHHKTLNTRPQHIEGHDLAICLFAIQRVLDFWFRWSAPR